MVALGISEFTFGFAFLHEQVANNWGNLVAAPILPSLQKENDLGWDAHLPVTGTDFYYQFKLSDYLSRSNANYIRDKTYATSYYRLALHKHDSNRQHQRLRLHSLSHPDTYYVAPEVHALDDFNNAYLSKQLTQRSRLIPIAGCKDITDTKQHYITFQQGNANWIEHSEMVRHEESFSGRDLSAIYHKALERSNRPIGRDFFRQIYDDVRYAASRLIEQEDPKLAPDLIPLLRKESSEQGDRELLISTSEVLSAVFGLTLVLVGEAG